MKDLSESKKGKLLCKKGKSGAKSDNKAARGSGSPSDWQVFPPYPSKLSRPGPVMVSKFTQQFRSLPWR